MTFKTTQELKAEGYTVERYEDEIRAGVRVFQHDVHVASLSPLLNGTLGFDWRRHDQWSLRSYDIEALVKETCR